MSSPNGYALVTGASSGIGLELARLFAADGVPLILTARRKPELEALAKELRAARDIDVQVVACDLSKPGSAGELARDVARGGWKVAHLVNNAGFGDFAPFHRSDPARIDDMVALNVASLTSLARAFLPGIVEAKGSLMNVASIAAFQPVPWMAAYGATKAYVLSLTEGIAEELRGTGVRVSCLCPGFTETPFHETARSLASRAHRSRGQDVRKVAAAGYAALRRGETVCLPSWTDWLMVQSVRFAPRDAVRRIASWKVGPIR